LPSQVNRLCARRTSRPCFDLAARYAFLDLVAYPSIASQVCREKCTRCRGGGRKRIPGSHQFMGGAASCTSSSACNYHCRFQIG
jgi:hypothetical protein